MRARTKQNRCDSCHRVAAGKYDLTLRHVIAQPAASVSGARRKHVMNRIKHDSDARPARKPVLGREHSRSIENKQRMRKITRSKHADSQKKTPERSRQFAHAHEEGTFRL